MTNEKVKVEGLSTPQSTSLSLALSKFSDWIFHVWLDTSSPSQRHRRQSFGSVSSPKADMGLMRQLWSLWSLIALSLFTSTSPTSLQPGTISHLTFFMNYIIRAKQLKIAFRGRGGEKKSTLRCRQTRQRKQFWQVVHNKSVWFDAGTTWNTEEENLQLLWRHSAGLSL